MPKRQRGGSDAINRVVDRAIARARQGDELKQQVEKAIEGARQAQETARRVKEQQGGRKCIVPNKRLDAIVTVNPSLDKTKVINALRSYKVYVNGILLIGDSVKQPGKRYFHGSPVQAARKVMSKLDSDYKKGRGNFKQIVQGIDNAVFIRLIEVTKGVYKCPPLIRSKKTGQMIRNNRAHKQHYEYAYYGWRQPITATAIGHKDKDGKQILAKFKSIAIPARGYETAGEAWARRREIGAKVSQGLFSSYTAQENLHNMKVRGKKQAINKLITKLPKKKKL